MQLYLSSIHTQMTVSTSIKVFSYYNISFYQSCSILEEFCLLLCLYSFVLGLYLLHIEYEGSNFTPGIWASFPILPVCGVGVKNPRFAKLIPAKVVCQYALNLRHVNWNGYNKNRLIDSIHCTADLTFNTKLRRTVFVWEVGSVNRDVSLHWKISMM